MGVRRTGVGRGYEEMDGANIQVPQNNNLNDSHVINTSLDTEFELSSVSVVPDGECFYP